LFLGKSQQKLLPPELHSNMHQSFVGWAFAPGPTGGVYNAPPDPLGGLLLKEGEEF